MWFELLGIRQKKRKLTPNIVFWSPNGIGVSRASRTTRKALGPDITRSIARPVSVFINLKIKVVRTTEKTREIEMQRTYRDKEETTMRK